jgi:hypothetical protein
MQGLAWQRVHYSMGALNMPRAARRCCALAQGGARAASGAPRLLSEWCTRACRKRMQVMRCPWCGRHVGLAWRWHNHGHAVSLAVTTTGAARRAPCVVAVLAVMRAEPCIVQKCARRSIWYVCAAAIVAQSVRRAMFSMCLLCHGNCLAPIPTCPQVLGHASKGQFECEKRQACTRDVPDCKPFAWLCSMCWRHFPSRTCAAIAQECKRCVCTDVNMPRSRRGHRQHFIVYICSREAVQRSEARDREVQCQSAAWVATSATSCSRLLPSEGRSR